MYVLKDSVLYGYIFKFQNDKIIVMEKTDGGQELYVGEKVKG